MIEKLRDVDLTMFSDHFCVVRYFTIFIFSSPSAPHVIHSHNIPHIWKPLVTLTPFGKDYSVIKCLITQYLRSYIYLK